MGGRHLSSGKGASPRGRVVGGHLHGHECQESTDFLVPLLCSFFLFYCLIKVHDP